MKTNETKQYMSPRAYLLIQFLLLGAGILILLLVADASWAANLPGSDRSQDLEAAGTLLRIVDTALFAWMARLVAGVLVLSSVLALKNQQFGASFMLIAGAIIAGTVPMWVKNIFTIGGGGTLFN